MKRQRGLFQRKNKPHAASNRRRHCYQRSTRTSRRTIDRLDLNQPCTSSLPLIPFYFPVLHIEPSPIERSPGSSFLPYSICYFDMSDERLACFWELQPSSTDFPPSPAPNFFYRSPDSPVRRSPENPYSPAFEFPPTSHEEAENLVNQLPVEFLEEILEVFDALPPNFPEGEEEQVQIGYFNTLRI